VEDTARLEICQKSVMCTHGERVSENNFIEGIILSWWLKGQAELRQEHIHEHNLAEKIA
jgi:hypothetical protein